MRTLALDPITGDLAVAGGRLVVVDGVDAITEHLKCRIRLWAGSWFADRGIGVPYLTFLGVPGTEALAESTLREVILTSPGIMALDEFSLSVNGATRKATISFKARATTGEVIDVRDFVAGAP